MTLFKVLVDGIPDGIPYSVLEVQGDVMIIETPDVFIRTVEVYDEETETTTYETEVWEPDLSMCEPASWADVTNLLHFDFRIGEILYTYGNTPGATYAGIADGVICIRDYPAFAYRTVDRGAEIERVGHYRRLRHPTVPPLRVAGDRFYIHTPEDYDDQEIRIATDPAMTATLADIELWRDGAYVRNYSRPRPEGE